jgi:hypothetical protein
MNIHIPLWLIYSVIGIFAVLEILRLACWLWLELNKK